jgi:hypothetical protein
VRVRVRERESERERERDRERKWKRNERAQACAYVFVCMCVCVCRREREEGEQVSTCVRFLRLCVLNSERTPPFRPSPPPPRHVRLHIRVCAVAPYIPQRSERSLEPRLLAATTPAHQDSSLAQPSADSHKLSQMRWTDKSLHHYVCFSVYMFLCL